MTKPKKSFNRTYVSSSQRQSSFNHLWNTAFISVAFPKLSVAHLSSPRISGINDSCNIHKQWGVSCCTKAALECLSLNSLRSSSSQPFSLTMGREHENYDLAIWLYPCFSTAHYGYNECALWGKWTLSDTKNGIYVKKHRFLQWLIRSEKKNVFQLWKNKSNTLLPKSFFIISPTGKLN